MNASDKPIMTDQEKLMGHLKRLHAWASQVNYRGMDSVRKWVLNEIDGALGKEARSDIPYPPYTTFVDKMNEAQSEVQTLRVENERLKAELYDLNRPVSEEALLGTANVTINSEWHIVPRHFTYEALVAIVYPFAPHSTQQMNPSAVYFCKNPRKEGMLHRGQWVRAEEGMHFTCVHTGNA